jgi:hypothetical protein
MARRSIHALATSWPYRAAPFGLPVCMLRRSGPRALDGNTEALRRALEPTAHQLARGLSVSAINTFIEHAWFPGSEDSTLAEHIGAVASRMLECCGPVVRLAPSPPHERAAHADAWRRLTLHLPADLLIAALPHDGPAPSDHVELLDPLLARVLEERVAETHLHVGAGLDFGVLWVTILHDLTWGSASYREYDDAGDGLGAGREHAAVLRSAMLARHMIFAFLWHRSEGAWSADFDGFLRDWLPRVERAQARRESGWDFFDAIGATWSSLHVGPERQVKPVVMRRALRILAGGKAPRIQSVNDLVESDPLSQWLGRVPGHARPETRLLQRALAYLRDQGREDLLFTEVFWQYVRVRTLVYGRLVQSPGTAGLDWFVRYYQRIRHYRGELDGREFECSQLLNERGLGLASIEVRTAPADLRANRDLVRSIAKQAGEYKPRAGRDRPQVGLLFHFIKDPEAKSPGTPSAKVYGTRYGRWFNSRWIQACEIGRMLEYQPETLLVLRGLDVASSEIGIPNWPLVPLFERVRQRAARAARRLAIRQPRWGVEGLSTTLHLGEEFRRLVDGLRRIHEAIDFGLLRPGDRIGHGLALGWNCHTWASTNPCVVQSRDDRLDDILWEIERYESGLVEAAAGRLASIRAEALKHVDNIYGKGHSLAEHQHARRQRFAPANLRRLDYPRRCRDSPPAELALLHRYLIDPDAYERGAELMEVHVDEAEVAFLDCVQRWLRHQLALLGITIESNPSSNLLIGDFADLRDHPTFRLSPLPGTKTPLDGRLPVSINTDDPITFATCLADEYAHMYFALIGQDVPTRDALTWLERAREAGWRSRFTLPASAERECLRALQRERR